MHEAINIFISCVPALALGYMMPWVFSQFGLMIEGPSDRLYMLLSVLIYPSYIWAAAWMIWYSGFEFTAIKFFLALFLVLVLAMLATWFNRHVMPRIRAGIRRTARWVYKTI